MNLGRYDDALTELDTATRLEPHTTSIVPAQRELLKLMKASNVR